MNPNDRTQGRIYAAIDLKSFYASVECIERGLDPLKALLVVADATRTEKTICLAVSPALKKFGLGGRCRLFEVNEKVRQLEREKGIRISYIAAPPRMKHYIEYSSKIYSTYLEFIAPEDMHVYSIDEVFFDITNYLNMYSMTPRELVSKMIATVYERTGITATGGIGENLYLAKIAMDVYAKKIKPDENGVRIAELDRFSYRRELWEHQPLTDFWRMGKGLTERLGKYGIRTMGDIARISLQNEELLYNEFGVDAELMIDHAWGEETCLMEDIKKYRPRINSLGSSQVLSSSYTKDKARTVIKEMADLISLELAAKGLETDGISMMVGYEIVQNGIYMGRRELKLDPYGRKIPKPSTGSIHIKDGNGNTVHTSSTRKLISSAVELYDRIVDDDLLVRRMSISLLNVVPKGEGVHEPKQLDLFADQDAIEAEKENEKREEHMQKALLDIKRKYGKNAILKGMDYEEGATARQRNSQIGGHKA